MQKLSDNWFIEGNVDLEYKKYVLLAYLQNAETKFNHYILYPELAELVSHYRNLVHFKESKMNLQNHFPENLIEIKDIQLIYEKVMNDDQLMSEIMAIVQQSIPLLKNSIELGKDVYNHLESKITFEPIGILPIYKNEGYFFIFQDKENITSVYQYRYFNFIENNQGYRSISTHFVENYQNYFYTTFEIIKKDLIKNNKELPNPAVFAITSKVDIPILESLLPIVKRKITKYL